MMLHPCVDASVLQLSEGKCFIITVHPPPFFLTFARAEQSG